MGASNTREARREAQRTRERVFNNWNTLFRSLYHNSVNIIGDEAVPKRYLLRSLINKGGIAYDLKTGLYLRYVGTGIDVYGLFDHYTLYGMNGITIERSADEVVILRANDYCYPMNFFFDDQCTRITDFDMAIRQNLEAIKTMTIAETTDDSFLTNANLIESRRVGATVFYRNKTSYQNVLKIDSTGAQYLVDKLMEARQQVINETLSALSISTANIDKRERVQTAEIEASNGFAIEMGKTLIDTFNHDAEKGGIPIRLERNTELLFENEIDNKIKETEVKNDEIISAK